MWRLELTGNTFGIKETLKSLGFRWKSKEKLWFKTFTNKQKSEMEELSQRWAKESVYSRIVKESKDLSESVSDEKFIADFTEWLWDRYENVADVYLNGDTISATVTNGGDNTRVKYPVEQAKRLIYGDPKDSRGWGPFINLSVSLVPDILEFIRKYKKKNHDSLIYDLEFVSANGALVPHFAIMTRIDRPMHRPDIPEKLISGLNVYLDKLYRLFVGDLRVDVNTVGSGICEFYVVPENGPGSVKAEFPKVTKSYLKWTVDESAICEDGLMSKVITVGIYGDAVPGFNTLDKLVDYFRRKGFVVSDVIGYLDRGWEMNLTGEPRSLFLAVCSTVPGYNSDSVQDFVDEYRVDESKVNRIVNKILEGAPVRDVLCS